MSNGAWFAEEDRILSDINITPLVDVALVLLIIFMITAPMMVQGAQVELPRTEPMDTVPDSQIIVSVSADGNVMINGEPVEPGRLEPRLSQLVTPGRPVQLHGDRRLAYGRLMEVMQVLQELQASISLIIEPTPPGR